MKPPNGYIGTAALLSFSAVAIIGYPSAAVQSAPGIAPDFQLWFLIIFLLGSVLTAYSAIPKSVRLLKNNWLVVPAVAIAVYFGFWLVNPQPVQENAGWFFVFSMFTLGAPFLPFILAFKLHRKSCAAIENDR